MKHTFSILLALLLTIHAQAFEFSINGTLVGKPTADKLYIHIATMMGQPKKAEAIEIVQNKFAYTGTAEEPMQCFLSWEQKLPEDRSKTFSFILDEGAIKIDIPQQGLPAAAISGSKTNDELKLYFSFQRQLQPEYEKFNRDAQAASQKSKNIDSLQSVFAPRMEALQKRAMLEQIKFIKSYPESFISMLSIFEVAKSTKDFVMADSLFQQLSAKVKTAPTAIVISGYIDLEKKISVGAVAPDFEQADANNKMVKLSSLRGKYVLLDFWASWCGPCRQENPTVVQAYNTYKHKGFTILGVSIDTDRGKWVQAVADDGLVWQQVLDSNNLAAQLYNVESIPSNFLVDDKGVIVARGLRGPDLEKALKQFLK